MKDSTRQRGSILLLVLLLAGLLGIFAAIAADVARSSRESSDVFADTLRADDAMLGAIEYAIGKTGSGIAHSTGTAVIQMARAKVTLNVESEAGRIDINYAPPDVIAGIFRRIGVEQAVAEAYAARIVDWRDTDDKVSPNGGAERAAYRAAGRTDGPRNGPFLHTSELALVLGIPFQAAAAVAPYVTVGSGLDKINPLYADRRVLLAIPGMNPDRVQDVLTMRQNPTVGAKALISRLGGGDRYLTAEPGAALRFKGLVTLQPRALRRYEVVVALVSGDAEPYRVLAWDAHPSARQPAMP
jgi:general secretion pathway protein K